MTMFGCIYQLWDWLEAPPLFTAASMDAKKLQQLQQQHQKKIPLAYQTNINDYRTATHSPVFQQQLHQQQQQQHQSYHMHPASLLNVGGYQQSPSTTNSSSGPLTPIDVQPQANKLLLKHHMSGGTTSSSSHSSPYHQPQYAATEQLYQSPPERAYLAAAGRLQATSQHNPSSALQQQYQQLQAAKMQVQMATQSEAVQQQQRTFAIRQQINPPVPQGHYHMSQSSSMMSSATLQQQQQQQQQQQSPVSHQRAPPSTLNLSSQFQPATGPLKVSQQQQQQLKAAAGQQHYQQQEQSIYAQQQQQLQLQLQLQHQQQLQQQQHQRLKSELQQTPGSEHSPVYIQQNHPGHVVNQACQTQISAVKTAGGVAVAKTPNSEDSSAGKSPSHAPLDRKKSSGSIQAIKSPITKRPAASTVALSGWLYKQGSDGLKVWRKRWFVLAEYCLYYYKGPEEEKLLGSILLPSYRVSACLAEDKIYRKYAFKCEHQNMRTYWLAAETAESMIQWVRALTAATMMQAPSSGESDQASQPSVSSSLNHSGENSDSGIHTLQSQQSKMSLNQGPVTPASENASSGGNNVNANSASSSNSGGGGAQPLYANAPPKPRRINDGGYSSPSPEHSIDNERNRTQQQQQQQQQPSRRSGGVMSPTLQQQIQQQQQYQQQLRAQQQAQQHHAIYDTRTGSVTSALRQQQLDNLDAQFQQQLQLDDYGKSPQVVAQQHYIDMEEQILRLQQQRAAASVDEIYGERELHMQKLIQQRLAAQSAYAANAERRTPDAYGRSKNRVFSDYEDIYNLTQGQLVPPDASYRRPISPPSYESNKHVPLMPARYTPNHLESSTGPTASSSNLNLRSRSATANIMRPHSADFLEYEARSEAANTASPAHTIKPDAIRAPRPKSSLDINRTPDSLYYSEASYAEKMRKSALYLQHPQQQQSTGASACNIAQPQQPALAAGGYRQGAAAEIYSPSGGMNTIGYENPYERVYKRNEMLNETQGGASSMPRMSRSMGSTTPGTTSHNRSASLHPHHRIAATPQQQQQQKQRDTQQQQFYQSTNAAASPQHQQFLQHEQFLRSASARLPKRGAYDEEYVDATGGMTGGTSPSAAQTAAVTLHQDGERKREESMKRLLEWKQRMLQSPLTRKGVQQTVAGGVGSNMTAMSKLGSNPNILLASTTVASGAHHGPVSGGVARGNTLVGGVSGIQRSRSETHANGGNGGGQTAGYNSYSSDDEDGTNIKSPAGRSTAPPTGANTNTTVSTTTTKNIGGSCVSNPKAHSSNHTKATTTTIAIVDNNTPITTLTRTTMDSTANLDIDAPICKNDNNTTNIKTTTIKTQQTTAMNTKPTITTKNAILDVLKMQNKIPSITPKSAIREIAVKPILKIPEKQVEDIVPQSYPLKGKNTKTGIKSILRSKTELQIDMTMLRQERERALSALTNTTVPSSPELAKEVPILPKKPAPKSPQNTNYIPVYTTKTLTAGEAKATKDYENVEILQIETNPKLKLESEITPTEEVQSCKTLKSILKHEPEHRSNEILTMCKEETPLLMNLQLYKATQEAKQLKELQQKAESSARKEAIDEATQLLETAIKQDEEEFDNDDDDTDTACEEYTDDDLDEALAEEEELVDEPVNVTATTTTTEDTSQIYENESALLTNITIQQHDESHYLPMTPKRVETTSLQSGNLSLVSLNDSIVDEENPYVEMTKGLHDDDSKSNYETVCIGGAAAAAVSKTKQLQIQTEPVYMELSQEKQPTATASTTATEEELHNSTGAGGGRSTLKKNSTSNKKAGDTLKKKSKKSSNERLQSKRKDLPDILKPSQSSLAISTDSSDADDESSKHIDSKKMRSRSRFSLSDTFRPASYYLGASTPLANCAESSDSEIVSPPPIPLSPPPMEELNTEEIFSSENYDTVKRRDSNNSSSKKFNFSYEQLPKIHSTSNTSLNIAKQQTTTEATLKSSRLSLPDQLTKLRGSGQFKATNNSTLLKNHERTLSDSNYSFQTDNSSNTSSDFDLYNKLKQNSPSFIASPMRYQSNSSLPQKFPTNISGGASGAHGGGTGDSSETDSVEFRQRQGSDSELERHRSRRPLSEESISEIESMSERFEETLTSSELDTYLNQLQTSDLYLYQNTTSLDVANSLLNEATAAAAGAGVLNNLIKPPEIFRNKDDDEHFYGNIHFMSSTDSLQKLSSERKEERNTVPKQQNIPTPTSHDECSGGLGTALDLFSRPTPIHSRNNSNISEQSAPYYYSELTSSRERIISQPATLNNQRDVHVHASGSGNIAHINNPIKLHGLNPATMDMLTEKDQAIDSKNLYKMKTNIEKLSYSTGKNLKSGEPFNQVAAATSSTAFHLQQVQCPQIKLSNFQTNLFHTTPHQHSLLTSSTPPTSPNTYAMRPEGEIAPSTSIPHRLAKNTNVQVGLDIGYNRGGEEALINSGVGVGTKAVVDDYGGNIVVAGDGGHSSAAATNIQKKKKFSKLPTHSSKISVLGTATTVGHGELLWEEDTLWRESLRRVSQRHARSLDDLDRITAASPVLSTKKELVERQNAKSRLSREVTYVNDQVSQHLRATFKPRLSDQLVAMNQRQLDEADKQNEDDDVYVQLSETLTPPSVALLLAADDMDAANSDVYEVLREDSIGSGFSHKSGDMDRETLRQWDSMSSGLMKNPTTITTTANSSSCSESNQGGAGGVSAATRTTTTTTTSNVKNIIQQLNANCDANGNPITGGGGGAAGVDTVVAADENQNTSDAI